YSDAKAADLRVTADVVVTNFAKLPIRDAYRACPYRALMVLKELVDVQTRQFRVLRELALLHPCKTARRADPKSPVTRADQTRNLVGGELLVLRRLPGDVSNTIETEQAEFRTQPKIAVGSLHDRVNAAFGKTVADFPGRVGVLADVEGRIQR